MIRRNHPGCGVEKMYFILSPETMGRDKFCEIFNALGYKVKKVQNRLKTTVAGHIWYPNLIEGMQVIRPSQVIQSDITYFDLHGKFYYLVFIIDVYTKEIIGHKASNHMRASANLEAMKMALKKLDHPPWGLIHHSDRGSQYGCKQYQKLLLNNAIHPSMGLKATDNAFAERINGTIKNEYLKRWIIKDEADLIRKLNKAVSHYNKNRKHMWFKNEFSPSEFLKNLVSLSAQEKPKVIIYTEGLKKSLSVSNAQRFCTGKEPQAPTCPMDIINSC